MRASSGYCPSKHPRRARAPTEGTNHHDDVATSMLTSRVLHPRRCVRLAVRLVPSVRTLTSRPGSASPDLYAEAERTVWGAPC